MKPKFSFTIVLLIVVGINASPTVVGQSSEIPINYVSRNGANVILDIEHSFTDSEYDDQTVAIYLVFTSDTAIEAAMFFLYTNYEENVYWMVGDPRVNPWNWNAGIKDQHYYFDDSSTIIFIFVEFLEIYDLTINLLTSVKLLPDFTYDESFVDFPMLLMNFPIVIYPSDSTSTSTTSAIQTSTTIITSSPTSTTEGSTTTGFSSIILIGALFFIVSKMRKNS